MFNWFALQLLFLIIAASNGSATNTPPVIEASDTFMIRVGETALYRLRITDPGDTITVTINGEFPYTLDQDGSIWTLNVTLSSLVEFNFTVIATDSFDATSAIAPHVIICSCTSDRGNCTIEEYEYDTSNPLILMCDCMEAYEGEYCEDDFDGCTEVSCFNNATCTDVSAPGTGVTCPPCPSGYTGDGIICYVSTSEFLPFLDPLRYNVHTNVDDGSVLVTLPATLQFGGFHYDRAYISSNGLVSFGNSFNSYSPVEFPLHKSLAVVAPYWDDSILSGSRQLRYQVVSGSSSLIAKVNAFLSNYTRDTFEADWLLWAYWHDVCPYMYYRQNCQESNFFQVAIAVQGSVTYSIFTYQCDLIRWTLRTAAVGYSVNGTYYENHELSKRSSVVDIDCEKAVSSWSNIVYRIDFTNTPPVIEASDTFMIRVGETALYRLRITDPGDTITVTIDGEFLYTLDQDGSIWTLNVALSSLVEFNFTVIATDSFNAISALTPQVIICSCTSDRGNCTTEEYDNDTSNPLILMCDSMEDTANSIDTNKRLKGIPSIHTNGGNKFCFSFLQNHEENTINILGIYIGTQEHEDVKYSIKSKINGVARNGSVKPGQIKKELYQYTSYINFETDLKNFNPPRVKGMVPLRSMSYTGIIVETVNSSHKISVMGFSDGAETSDGFTAIPMVDMSNVISIDYQYSIFAAGGKESSIAAITMCDDFEAENVTINATPVSQGSFLPFNGSTPRFQTYVINSSDHLNSSINVVATQPIGFMTGHECGQTPIDQLGCDHLIEQVPPSYTWGYNFLTAPFHTNNFGYILKLLPGKDFDTNFKIICTLNTTVTVNTTVQNFVRTDIVNRGIFNITTQSYCTIQSNKPLAVMQYATSHSANDPNSVPTSVNAVKDLGDPAMVWIPAVSQYLNKYLITNDVSIRSQSFTSNGIYVTVLPHCFNASAILDNDIPLENNASNWSTFHCSNITDICGYGVSVDISQGTHLLKHRNESCSFSAIMFGWGNKKGYAYPAGFGMRPIGVTFYSIEPLISSAQENGLVSVTVHRSGDVSDASSVQLGTFSSSKYNAATIGIDLKNQTKTINFAANEFSATVYFTLMNDNLSEQDEVFQVQFVDDQNINIGAPSEAELTILGDSRIIAGGGSSPGTGPNVVVQEGDRQVKVCITLSGLFDSSYPEPVKFLFTPMEKSEALQPAQEEDYNNTAIAVIMLPGYTEVCAHVNTVEDKIYNEPNEQFCINVTSNVSIGIFHPAECQITVTIIDNRGSKGSIDINRRLKGVPKSSTTEGNRFCFSFFETASHTTFLIKIGTLESFPVEYHISSGVNEINKTNTVQPGSINTEQYQYIPGNNESRLADEPLMANMTLDSFNSRDINDFTGIVIETVNSSHKISVTCFIQRENSELVDSFVAVPIVNVASITQQYNYSMMFNEYGNNMHSQTVVLAAIVVCDTIKAGGVTLAYSNTSIPGDYFGTLNQHGLRSSQIKFKKYYTPSIPFSPPGTDVYATQPIGFMIGHACVSHNTRYCDYLIKQVPPSYTWGYNFLIGPGYGHFGYIILKFFPGKKTGTNFTIFCANSTSVTINALVQNFTKTDHMVLNKGTFNIDCQDYCTVQSNKPLAVMLYFNSTDMVWIPPVSQYLNRYLVTIHASSYSFPRGVYVTVLPHCFDPSAILDNDNPLESNVSKWDIFHCDNITDSCGYGISVNIQEEETHLLKHIDPSCSFGAIMFDWGEFASYACPAGFGMRPIGVTFYSIEPLISSAQESGLVSITVYRSGDVSEASSVQVGTFMSSKSNAAMIGQDLENQTKTINFAANEFLATVNFSLLSDSISELDKVFLVGFVKDQNINIGTPSEVELTILADSNIVKFTADNYCVHEGNTSVYVCVEKSRDTVNSVSLEITAMEDSTPSAAENIFDFVAETKTINFPGSSTQVCAQFQIIQDPFVDFKESIETFNVNFTATGHLGGSQMKATDKSIVTISEHQPEISADSVPRTNSIFAPESQENVTVCVNRTFRFSCTRNVTFKAMDSASSIKAKSGSDFVAETIEVPFTSDDLRVCATFMLINDDIVEKNESFLITVTAPDHIPKMLRIKITITDEDDAAVIRFTNYTYTFPENIDMDARICVETTKVLSDEISVNFTTRSNDTDGAATADLDYMSKSETKTLRNGSKTVCISIEIKPDAAREATEFFYVQFEVLNVDQLMNNSYYGSSRLNVSNSEPALVNITDTSVAGCESIYADLMLLISESSSMQENQFTMLKNLAAEILNQLPIGKNMTHAGIVRLSNSSRTQVISPLGSVTDLKQLKQIVKRISVDDEDDRGLATHPLTYSMNLTMNEITERGRPNSRKIIVIITDDHLYEAWPYDIARNATRVFSYDIFAVCFFTNSSLSNWEKLTGYKERVLFLSTFNSQISHQSERANFFISQICNISVGPQLLSTVGEKKKINFGESVSFNCTADGVPVPDIVWRKDGKYIIPKANRRNTSLSNSITGFRINEIPQVMQRTSELIITNLTVSDTGSYSCRADNGIDRGVVLTIPYHLTVEGLNETNYCLNSHCKNHGTCQSLASTYICNCPETHTGNNCQERVRVTVKPKIIEFRQPVNTQLYSSVNFTCKAIGSPAPSIHWYKDNKLINSTDPSLLMFNDLSLNDRGVYHCEARNVINGVNMSVNTTKVLLNIEDVLQYKAIMSLTDDFYDNLNDSELFNGTIQQLVKDINYNLSGKIIGNSNLLFIDLLNSDEIDPDDDPENVSLLITLITNNQKNWLNHQITMNLGNSLGLMITDVVRFDGCPTSSTTVSSNFGDPIIIKWPETNIGEIAVVNCPCGSNDMSAGGTLKASRSCGGDFTNGALWQAPSVMKCKLSDLARMICQLKDQLFPTVSYVSMIDVVEQLEEITNNSSKIGFTEVAASVSVLETAAEFANTIAGNAMLITSLFEVIDNLLAVNQEILIESQALSNSSSRILAIISHMASILNITNASSPVVKIHTYFAVSIHETNFGDFRGKMLTINLTDSYNVSLKTERNIVSSTGSVTLPSSNFNSSSINRITNIVYLTDSLFLRHRFNYFKVISDVISTSILREFDAIIELESPVNLSFQLNSDINGSFLQCVFWDQSLNSGYGDWSSDNCNTSNDSITQAIKCFCNPLGSFAVIQDVSPTKLLTDFRVYYLDSVSYIGIIISTICLIITIVFYLYNKDLRLSDHCQMLLNYCFALIGLYLSFITSIHTRNNNSFCAVSGFMLQFFFLVCLTLMSAEAIGLYINILNNSYKKFFHLKVTLVSWIAPIFIVMFCFSPSYMNYINNSSNFCRAFDTPFYIGMVIPFVIIYSLIWIVFIIIIISLLMSSRIKDSNKKKVLKPSYKYQLILSLAHSTLFGLSSVLMLIMTEDTFTNKAIRDLLVSLFVLLTGCHGLFLFVVHCLCTKDFYRICKGFFFGIKSLLLHAVQKKLSTNRNDTVICSNQYLETELNSNLCQDNLSSHLEQLLVKYSISASQINLQEVVGQGEFGIVYRALLATDDTDIPQVVAVKTLKGLFSRSNVVSIVEESLIMSNFNNPNVLSLIGVSLDLGPAPCIIMPFMSRGSLLSYLKKERLNITITDGKDEEIILNVRKHLLSICLQVTNGMCYLASQYFVHRDLAARNCMIDNNGVIKVADFGLSEEVYTKTYFNQFKDENETESVKLPIKWIAIESIHDGIFSEKSDVWSYGVLCWEVFNGGKTPFPGIDPAGVIEFLDTGGRLSCPHNDACSDEIYALMQSCWYESPLDRPLFSDLNTSINALIDPLAQYLNLQL